MIMLGTVWILSICSSVGLPSPRWSRTEMISNLPNLPVLISIIHSFKDELKINSYLNGDLVLHLNSIGLKFISF